MAEVEASSVKPTPDALVGLDRVLHTSPWRVKIRRLLVVAVHVALWGGGLWLALKLRFDGNIPSEYLDALPHAVALLVISRAIAFYTLGLFHGLWRYAGVSELERLVFGTTFGTVAFAGLTTWWVTQGRMPRSVYVGEWLLAIMLLGGTRLLTRRLWERRFGQSAARTRTLLIGAGNAGESLLRDILRLRESTWAVMGFLDDDPTKRGALIHGVRVLGPASEEMLSKTIRRLEVELVILAIPAASGDRVREITGICRRLNVEVKTTPNLPERIGGAFKLSSLRQVEISDLLRRDPVQLDVDQVAQFIQGKTVLITGAGGSIGSELARQSLRFAPQQLVLFDHDENALFYIERELAKLAGHGSIRAVVGDICDPARVDWTFREFQPAVVLHAAAHKHVPLMEANPCEAVKNNVFGSLTLARAARLHGVESFVLISTDKAVKPSSVMGATKRVSEIAVESFARQGSTRYIAVRFGNVLGSAGSVVPVFQSQISSGGPVTVTHPEMCRYFMTIPEASQLVLQAGALGGTGEIFLLDMGQPVKIVDLARDLIELSGLQPDVDIPIEFTGLRPGEKLVEELLTPEEGCDRTTHPKIMIGRIEKPRPEAFQDQLEKLREAAYANDPGAVRRVLGEIVPDGTLLGGHKDVRDMEPAQQSTAA